MLYLGFDPGKSGALATFWSGSGTAIAYPFELAGGELDLQALAARIRTHRNVAHASGGIIACVEKVGAMPGQGVVSMFSFGTSYGMIRGILTALEIRTELVTPQAWKKSVLAGTTKDKDAAIAYVRRAFPATGLIQPGCRVPHSGMADALCIAEYARRTYAGV